MTLGAELRKHARLMLGSFIGLGLAFYFGYHAMYGARGMQAVRELDRRIESAKEVLDFERNRRDALERRVALLRPTGIDPDLLEERARLLLNVGRANDYIVLEPSAETRKQPTKVTSP